MPRSGSGRTLGNDGRAAGPSCLRETRSSPRVRGCGPHRAREPVRAEVPAGSRFKGDEDVLVQDVIVRAHVIPCAPIPRSARNASLLIVLPWPGGVIHVMTDMDNGTCGFAFLSVASCASTASRARTASRASPRAASRSASTSDKLGLGVGKHCFQALDMPG